MFPSLAQVGQVGNLVSFTVTGYTGAMDTHLTPRAHSPHTMVLYFDIYPLASNHKLHASFTFSAGLKNSVLLGLVDLLQS